MGLFMSAMNVIIYHSNKLKTLLMTKRSLSVTVIVMKMVAVYECHECNNLPFKQVEDVIDDQ